MSQFTVKKADIRVTTRIPLETQSICSKSSLIVVDWKAGVEMGIDSDVDMVDFVADAIDRAFGGGLIEAMISVSVRRLVRSTSHR